MKAYPHVIQAFPGGTHASRGIAAVRVRHRCTAPRAGTEFFSGDTDDNILAETSNISKVSSSQPRVSSDSEDVTIAAKRLESTVSLSEEMTEGMRNCSEDDFQPTAPSTSSSFDPLALRSTLVSGPMVAMRHKAMDAAASPQDAGPSQVANDVSSTFIDAAHDTQTDSHVTAKIQPVSVTDTPAATTVSIQSAPKAVAPVATPPPRSDALQSAPSTPIRVAATSDTFTTGSQPSPGNYDSFITGRPSPSATTTPRPYLASGPATDSHGYPAFKFDESAASQYSAAAQSIPMRPNYEPRYPLSRSSNCDSPPPKFADALSSSKSVGMPSGPAEGYSYKRLPQEAVPGPGYSRASVPQPQAPPHRAYQYRLPPDYGSPGGPLPLSPPGGRSLPPQGYGPPPNDPWDIHEPGNGSTIGFPQGLLHIDSGGYGGGGGYGPGGGYGAPSQGYGGPPAGYGGYGPGPAPPPPPPQYQYGGHGGGGGYGQQQQYYAPPPPGAQYGGAQFQPGSGAYRGPPPPQAEPGQYYGNNSAPASPRRPAPPPEPNYTYKARAPAGNVPEENLSYSYGNSYAGGTGFGSGGNYGGQTSYGSPVPGNYSGGGAQQEEASYPGIELLSPGYPEFERHARQTGGSGGGGRNASQELRYPGIEGGSANVQQQRAIAPSGITEYSDRMTPPAYGSSYSGYTAPSAYEPPPPDAYAQYQQQPHGGYYVMPPPGPAESQYGYGGYPGYPGAGAAQYGAYPQRPMGFTSPEEAMPITARQPRVLVLDELSPGARFWHDACCWRPISVLFICVCRSTAAYSVTCTLTWHLPLMQQALCHAFRVSAGRC